MTKFNTTAFTVKVVSVAKVKLTGKKKVNLREISSVEVRVERERGQTSFCIPNGGEGVELSV